MKEKLRALIKEKTKQRPDTKVTNAAVLNPGSIERIPTGISAVDRLLGAGKDGKKGIGRGDVTIVCGPTHTGKSTLSSQIIAKAISDDPDKVAVVYSGEQQAGEFKFYVFQQLAGSYMTKMPSGQYAIPDSTDAAIRQAVDMQLIWLDTRDAQGKLLPQREKWTHIRSEAEAYAEAGAQIFLIDNVMKLTADIAGSKELRTQSELERQTFIGSWAEEFAKTYNVWVILVAHYRKSVQGIESTGPENILGSSSISNSAGYIIEYNRYSDIEINGNPKKPEEQPGDPSLEYSRKVKIWKNRGNRGILQTRGIRTYYDAQSSRIWTDKADIADEKYPWRDRLNDSKWLAEQDEDFNTLPFV